MEQLWLKDYDWIIKDLFMDYNLTLKTYFFRTK